MPDFRLKPLPARFGRQYCERYRIDARKRLRPTSTGRHLQLYRGQSLEFRDFAEYNRGDDVRNIDWRASARYRGPDDRLVRKFAAEEAFRLVISLDSRDSLYHPRGREKVQQAAWLAELLGCIALYAGDQLYLHRLFGPSAPAKLFRSPQAQVQMFSWLQRNLLSPAGGQHNLDVLRQVIYPVAAWVVISDFYFETEGAATSNLARFIREADEGWRWVILINLNSWPYERSFLTARRSDFAWRVTGPGLAEGERVEFDDPDLLSRVDEKIRTAHSNFCQEAHRDRFDSTWDWAPFEAEPLPAPQDEFRRHFEKDRLLKRLFMRSV